MDTATTSADIPALYLRSDGTLMLVRGGHCIEIRLQVEQLLQLGVDALRVAVDLNPQCLLAAAEALASTRVLPAQEVAPCRLN